MKTKSFAKLTLDNRRVLILAVAVLAAAGGALLRFTEATPTPSPLPPSLVALALSEQSVQAQAHEVVRQLVPEYAGVSSLVVSEDFLVGFSEGIELVRKALDLDLDVMVLQRNPPLELQAQTWFRESALAQHPQHTRLKLLAVPHESMWVRDFGPHFTRWSTPPMASEHALARRLTFVDTIYRDDAYLDDTVPYMLGLYLNQSVEHLPLYLDGGSVLLDDKKCYIAMTQEHRAKLLHLQDEAVVGEQVLEKFKAYLAALGACQEVVLFFDPPHGHIDMWAKIVNNKTVLVSELTEAGLATVAQRYGEVPPQVMRLKERLDRAAARFAEHLQVERVPMPVPMGELFLTYTNSLLINGHAVIPTYHPSVGNFDPPDAALYPDYEAKALARYARHGLQTHGINSDRLIEVGGALHCAALQLPEL